MKTFCYLLNEKFWQDKIDKNIQRDLDTNEYYIDNNWNILRIWEHEIIESFDDTIDKIVDFIVEAKHKYSSG